MKNVLIGLAGALALVVGCGGSSTGSTGAAGSAATGAAGSGAAGAAGSGAAGTSATGAAGSGAACTNTAACGGDLVGSWRITDSCASSGELPEPSANCPTQTGSTDNFKIAGTVVYNADGSYVATTSTTGNVIVNYPSACLTTSGISCEMLSQGVMDELSMPGAPFTAGSCVTTPAGCACTLAINPASSVEAGRYTTTAAGTLTQTPTAGDTGNSSYCVKGNTLTLSPNQGTTMMGQSITETITLVR